MTFKTASGKLIEIFALTENNRGSDLDTFHTTAVENFNAGAMESTGLNTFRSNMIVASEEPQEDAAQSAEIFSVETGQPVKVMPPLRYRRGWMRL